MEFSLQASDPTVTYWRSLRVSDQSIRDEIICVELVTSLTTTLTRLSSWDSPYLTPLSYARKHLQSNSKIDRKKPLSFQRPSGKRILCTGKRQGIFAIGGHVQYDGAAGGDTTEGDTTSSNAKVAIRWDGYSTLRLPLADDTTQLNTPVTMDADNIWTDFNLAAYGILETINQTLVQSKHSEKRAVAVKAELCKLDVFSAESDTSQPLVNNPDLGRQMGSLVVCLPVAHKGGQIAFRHDGQQVEFDGASQHSETIQWAAFLSACEHEVLPITEGHRVMLTYNLVWSTWGHGFMANQRHILDQESTHFYTDLEKLIEKIKSTGERKQSRPFSSCKEIDHMLKGIDMVVYQALVRFVCNVSVGAVLDDSRYVEGELESKQMELERLAELANNPNARRSRRHYYDDSDLENTFCITEDLSDLCIDDWYRGDDDSYVPNPLRHLDGYSREKVHWLNHAPDTTTHQELALSVYMVAESEPECASFYSSVAIFARVGEEVDKDDEEDEEVDEEGD
ncbi:unnamed protein product [Fusarium graminearum]|nr:unnamed protein product [Fusarium graminearum]